QVKWLIRLEEDHDNLRAAIEWGIAEPPRRPEALNLATCLWWLWVKRGYFREGLQQLESALAASPEVPPQPVARALIALIHLTMFERDLVATRALIAKALSKGRIEGDLWAEAFALGCDAIVASDAGNFSESAARAAEARDIALRCTDPLTNQPL